MKIVVDLNNPDDVTAALALLTGETDYQEAAEQPAPPPPSRAPAGRTPGKPAAAAPGKPAAGRPAPGRAQASAPARSSAQADTGGVSKDEFAAAVQAYAKANGPAAAKAAFAEYGASIGAEVKMISNVPEDDYDNAILYFPA